MTFKQKPILASLIDKEGNSLVKRADGTMYLKLTSDSKEKAIGKIKDNVFYVSKDSKKHTFRATNSYGFNFHLLTRSKFEYIHILEDKSNEYMIPKSVVIDCGEVMNFKNSNVQSFELQIFLDKETIHRYKI